MDKNIIRQIILDKRNNGMDLTSQEKRNALKFFTSEEIMCMRFPSFNHKSCFLPRSIEKKCKQQKLKVLETPSEDFFEKSPEKLFEYGNFNP